MFVLFNYRDNEFYLGKNYVYQGGWFPCFCSKDKAKRYTSRKSAENAAEAVANRTGVRFEAIELTQ